MAKGRTAAQAGERILYEIVSTVGSSLDLSEVLGAVVRLLTDASAVHACFVYLIEDDRLVLRAASEPYGELVGEIALDNREGIAWWAVKHGEPAFTQNAVDDPRNKFVPELEEEKFQSLLSVPVSGRDGDVIGAITMHTEAPREFTAEEVERCWAAGVWIRAFDSKKQYAVKQPVRSLTPHEARERLRRAGVRY